MEELLFFLFIGIAQTCVSDRMCHLWKGTLKVNFEQGFLISKYKLTSKYPSELKGNDKKEWRREEKFFPLFVKMTLHFIRCLLPSIIHCKLLEIIARILLMNMNMHTNTLLNLHICICCRILVEDVLHSCMR